MSKVAFVITRLPQLIPYTPLLPVVASVVLMICVGSHVPLGWIVDVAITTDKTPYRLKDGETGSNLYEKLSFKCVKQPMVGVADEVVPVNPVCTIWGEYRNNLSVKCDAVVLASTVTTPAGKDKVSAIKTADCEKSSSYIPQSVVCVGVAKRARRRHDHE